jgi:thiopeptide-type bacteriocin biosynthesis protein
MKKVQRLFIPGDTWVYYKIYCGIKTSDTILTEIVKPSVQYLMNDGLIEQWFFIRYNDPDHHLRLRFKCSETKKIGEVMNFIFPKIRNYVDDGLIWNVQIDSYKRELQRYGEETIEASEFLFFNESEMIVNFLDFLDEGEEGEMLRWLFSLRALDQLLMDFGCTLTEKLHLLETLKQSFGEEFGINKALKRQLDKKYRDYKSSIENFLMDPSIQEIEGLIQLKSENTRISIKEIKEKTSKQRQYDLLSSYAHMLMNRLFRSKNRLHEMTMYQFLHRYFKTAYGRAQYKKKLQ